jgi:hypothetical protein
MQRQNKKVKKINGPDKLKASLLMNKEYYKGTINEYITEWEKI